MASGSVLRHPGWICGAALVVTVAAGFGLGRLHLRTDGHALVPEDHPTVLFDRSVREDFGLRDLLVVVLRTQHPDGVCNTATLTHVLELTRRLTAIDGIGPEDVASLATESSDWHRPNTMRFEPLLAAVPTLPVEFERLRKALREVSIYRGTLISDDETATAITVGVPEGDDRRRLHARVAEIVAEYDSGEDEVAFLGAPAAEELLGRHILEDLGLPTAWLGLVESTTRRALGLGLVPIAVLLLAIVFLIAFRSFAGVLLPLVEVGAALIIVFGVMGYCGVPVYLTIAVLPVILTAIGVADEVHVYSRYVQLRSESGRDDVRDVVARTMREMAPPVTKTSVTTAIGFLSFALSPIPPVRAFGFFMAFGVMVCLLWTLFVVPALIVLLRPGAPSGSSASFLERACEAIVTRAARRRAAIVVMILVLAIAAPFGIQRIAVQDSWVEGFSPDSELRRETESFDAGFLGSHLLRLVLRAEPISLSGTVLAGEMDDFVLPIPAATVAEPDWLVGATVAIYGPGREGVHPSALVGETREMKWMSEVESVEREGEFYLLRTPRRRGSLLLWARPELDTAMRYEVTRRAFTVPAVLAAVDGLEEALRGELTVGGVIGPPDLLKTTRMIVKAKRDLVAEREVVTRDPTAAILPESVAESDRLWRNHRVIRGDVRHRRTVSEDYDRGVVNVYLEGANFADTARLMDKVDVLEHERLAPLGLSVDFAGDIAVSQSLIDAIVTTQVRSLLLSLVGILIVATLLGRSLRWGVVCVLPCAVTVTMAFAVMGWAGIPLGVATSMFAGMVIGIGVDFAIHLLARIEREPLGTAARVAGPAIVIDAIAVALAFGVLTLSQVPANARLGLLALVCIVTCAVATLVVVPASARSRESVAARD